MQGTLVGMGLPALLRLLTGLRKTGCLRLVDGRWCGLVYLDGGAVTAAFLGSERGLQALDAMLIAIPRGRFVFVHGQQTGEVNIVLRGTALQSHVDEMAVRTVELCAAVPSVFATPQLVASRLVSSTASVALDGGAPATESAQQTLKAVNGQRTVLELAVGRGLARTVEDLARLTAGGLISFGGGVGGVGTRSPATLSGGTPFPAAPSSGAPLAAAATTHVTAGLGPAEDTEAPAPPPLSPALSSAPARAAAMTRPRQIAQLVAPIGGLVAIALGAPLVMRALVDAPAPRAKSPTIAETAIQRPAVAVPAPAGASGPLVTSLSAAPAPALATSAPGVTAGTGSPTPASIPQRAISSESDLRTGQLDAAISYDGADQSTARLVFDLGDGVQPPRMRLTSTYSGPAGMQSVERIIVGNRVWERLGNGRWSAVPPREAVWHQVRAFLPGTERATSPEVLPSGDGTELRWHDPGYSTDVSLTVDSSTGMPRRLQRLTRSTGGMLRVTYSGWNTPVDIAAPEAS
ncbi:MAG: DUF4388 domain-containing protein [Chloroflexota bacterium]|nr:DUF4388 domain-containing protein [Chloroflexota bacterium]